MNKEAKVKKRVRRVKINKETKNDQVVNATSAEGKKAQWDSKKIWSTVLIVAIVAIALFVIMIGVYVAVSYFSPANKIVKILEEGNTALENKEYSVALESYRKALELKPESEEIKNHISNVYVMQAVSYGDTEDAITTYQMALSYDITNAAAYWGIANIYELRQDEEHMLLTLQDGYTNSGDTVMKEKIDVIQEKRAQIKAQEEAIAAAEAAEEAERQAKEAEIAGLLSPLAELFEAGDLDEVKEKMREEEYVSMTEAVIGDNVFYYGEKDEEGNRNGKGLGVYEHGYYYYGDYVNNVRSGQGIWMRAVYSESSSIGSYLFKGEWSDDKPNGKGEATSNFYKEKIGATGLAKQVITGVYKNGLEEGKMSMVGTSKAGKTFKYSYETTAGVAKKINNESTGVKGQYYIADAGDSVPMLMSDGTARGVEGFLSQE